MDTTELRRQHDEIGLTAALLAKAAADDRRPQSVAALRWKLARQLLGHLALEDRILYPAMQRSPDERTRATAIALQRETGALAVMFSSYISVWSDDRIVSQWPAFCTETRQILTALGKRIELENRTLYPLAQAVPGSSVRAARHG